MNRTMPLFQLLARLPAAMWVRIVLAVVAVGVVAVFGMALLAAVAGLFVLALIGFRLRELVARLFGHSSARSASRPRLQVQDAEYVIIERRDRV